MSNVELSERQWGAIRWAVERAVMVTPRALQSRPFFKDLQSALDVLPEQRADVPDHPEKGRLKTQMPRRNLR